MTEKNPQKRITAKIPIKRLARKPAPKDDPKKAKPARNIGKSKISAASKAKSAAAAKKKKGKQGDGGGRPRIPNFTKAQISEVELLASVLNKSQLSDYFGISERSFLNMEERQPEVSAAYKRGKAKAISNIGINLIKQARSGNTAAAIFYLKTQAGWKETVVNEHANKDGVPFKTDSVTPEEAAAAYQAALKELEK